MTRRWPHFLRFREQRAAWGTALALVVGWAVFLGASMAPGPAAVDLSFPPEEGPGTASAPAGGRPGAAPAAFLRGTTPASFAALFGILPATPAPASSALPAAPIVAVASLAKSRLSSPTVVTPPKAATPPISPPGRPAPPPPNLTTLGYRLRGIIRGDPETTAVFLWDPKAGREVLVRREASGAFRLLRVADREVELETPLGSGVLSLAIAELTRMTGGVPRDVGQPSSTPPRPSPAPSPSLPTPSATTPNPGLARLESGKVLDLLNSKAWRPVQERGHWVVAVDSLPPGSPADALGLKPGDRILAVGDSGFTRPEEIPQRVARISAGGRLVVLRGGRLVPLQITPPGNGQTAGSPGPGGVPPQPGGVSAPGEHGFPAGGPLPPVGVPPGQGSAAPPSGVGLPPPGGAPGQGFSGGPSGGVLPPPGGQPVSGAVPAPPGVPFPPSGGPPGSLPPGGVPQAGR